MRIIQIQLYVLMWFKAAETLDQLTDLGQNVTINCDLDKEEVYWISLKQSDSPTVILQSFSNPTKAFYLNKIFKNKYSVQSKHRLIIYNVTHDDVGVYYCMNTDTPPKLSNSTRLHINVFTEPTVLSEFNTNPTNVTEQQINLKQWTTFILIFGLLTGVLIITGLLNVCAVEKGCWRISGNRSGQHHKSAQQTKVIEDPQDPNQLQYVTVVFKAV